MGAEANGEETLDETQEVDEGQEETVPVAAADKGEAAETAGVAESEGEAADPMEARVRELEAQLAAQSVEFKLTLSGARNIKAAKALLDEHDGDVDALKAAEPWLFETSQPTSQEKKPRGKTGLPNAGTAVDPEKQMKHWREIAGLAD